MITVIEPGHGQPQELPPQPLNMDDLPLEYWELLDAREQEIRRLANRVAQLENRLAHRSNRDSVWPDFAGGDEE